eukprot:m.11058 g.11058  ORF g.11058 m.11058 type:complete len:56 (+) comp4389_c0_seq2:1149-1316(+)
MQLNRDMGCPPNCSPNVISSSATLSEQKSTAVATTALTVPARGIAGRLEQFLVQI